MFKTYFDPAQLAAVITAGFFIFLSLYFFLKGKHRPAVFFLFTAAVAIYVFAALLDPFLNFWDERFHALVAKNLLDHPLKPTLYDDPVVNMAYDRWDRFHVWLHKPPLFLWQIAGSFKLFGVSEFTLRLPSVILSSVLIFFAYRIGKLLVNPDIGYYTSFLFATSFYMVELVSGRQELDHNDISFLVYISASIWAWVEYLYSGKKYWIYLVGIFSGFAILSKWLAGLLVFLGWLVFNIISYKQDLKRYLDLILSLGMAILIAIPWQVFIIIRYPGSSAYQFEQFFSHFTRILDGHEGNAWFYLENISDMYGKTVPYILWIGLILLYRKIRNKAIGFAILAMPLFVYIFFSLARTKMANYVFIASPFIFLCLGCLADWVVNKIRQQKLPSFLANIIVFLFLVIIGFSNLDIEKIQENHTLWKRKNNYVRMNYHNREVFTRLKKTLPANSVIFNVRGRHYIEGMFYTGFPCYHILPDSTQCKDLGKRGRTIAVFRVPGTLLPGYIEDDPGVILISEHILGDD